MTMYKQGYYKEQGITVRNIVRRLFRAFGNKNNHM